MATAADLLKNKKRQIPQSIVPGSTADKLGFVSSSLPSGGSSNKPQRPILPLGPTPATPPSLPINAPTSGNDYIQAREKALARGATKEQAQQYASDVVNFKGAGAVGSVNQGVTTAEVQSIQEQLSNQAAQPVAPTGLNKPITFNANLGTGGAPNMVTTTLGESLANGATAAAIIATGFSLAASSVSTFGQVAKSIFGKGTTIGVGVYITRSLMSQTRADIANIETNYDSVIKNLQSTAPMSETDALNQISSLETALDNDEAAMKMASANGLTNFLTGGKEALVDIQRVRNNLIAKRALLAEVLAFQRANQRQGLNQQYQNGG